MLLSISFLETKIMRRLSLYYLIWFFCCSLVTGLIAELSCLYPKICWHTQSCECCSKEFIRLNASALQAKLHYGLYGQHLVSSAVIKHIKAHKTKDPSKALALSFHGGTGTGKNYVSKMIAESIYEKGMRSKYVHLISVPQKFPHKEMALRYKDELRDIIESGVKQCQQSLFIFDEIDKMPPGIIDTVKPYLDSYEHLDGVDYRKAIFLFLSNTAGTAISQFTLDYWQLGHDREDIALSDMEKVIHTAALNQEKTGMFHSNLLIDHMMSALIPFLPMQRKHIRKCIIDRLIVRGFYKSRADIPDKKVREISKQLQYYPENVKMFSVTGCKRVPEKVDYVMMEDE